MRSCMLQQEMMPDSSGKYIGIPISQWQLERDHESPSSTQETSLLPCRDYRRIPRCPSKLDRSPDITEKTWVFQECPHRKSRGNPRFLLQLERNHEIFPLTVIWGPIPLHCLQSNSVFHIKQERRLDFLYGIPESTQEHHQKSRGNLRSLPQSERAPCTPKHLEMRANSHSSFGEESRCSTHIGSAAFSHLWKLEKNPKVPAVSRKDIAFPSAPHKDWLHGNDLNGTLSFLLQH